MCWNEQCFGFHFRDEITNNPVYKIGQSKDKRFELQVTVVNFEEDAHDTKFFTNLPQYLQFVNTDTDVRYDTFSFWRPFY